MKPSNEAWFEMADTEFETYQWYDNFRVIEVHFNSF